MRRIVPASCGIVRRIVRGAGRRPRVFTEQSDRENRQITFTCYLDVFFVVM